MDRKTLIVFIGPELRQTCTTFRRSSSGLVARLGALVVAAVASDVAQVTAIDYPATHEATPNVDSVPHRYTHGERLRRLRGRLSVVRVPAQRQRPQTESRYSLTACRTSESLAFFSCFPIVAEARLEDNSRRRIGALKITESDPSASVADAKMGEPDNWTLCLVSKWLFRSTTRYESGSVSKSEYPGPQGRRLCKVCGWVSRNSPFQHVAGLMPNSLRHHMIARINDVCTTEPNAERNSEMVTRSKSVSPARSKVSKPPKLAAKSRKPKRRKVTPPAAGPAPTAHGLVMANPDRSVGAIAGIVEAESKNPRPGKTLVVGVDIQPHEFFPVDDSYVYVREPDGSERLDPCGEYQRGYAEAKRVFVPGRVVYPVAVLPKPAAPATSPAAVESVEVEMYALILQNERGAWIDKVAIPNCTEETLDQLQIEADLFDRTDGQRSKAGHDYKRAVVVAIKGSFPLPQPIPRPIPQINLNAITQTVIESPNFEAVTNRWFEVHNGVPRSSAVAKS